ncbi:MAG TPA: prolyl oligopeptidase family serine peptidase [Rhizomicrobium sp.]|nr:prolyl oligopeptidase family serine peptidase [Rhizomicrobium sp.]
MQFGKWMVGVVLAGALAGGWQAIAVGASSMTEQANVEDPFLWLEDIHGAKPLDWVKQQNARSLGVLQADADYKPYYDSILSVLDATDRIPYGQLDHNYVFNFWQDAEHPKGVWRRTTIADYANPNPKWENLLDVDKLAADEHENWVWKGGDCEPSLTHCLVGLSRGGGDAVVVREFDLATKSFLKDGFALTEAKSSFSYIDDNTVLFGTDFGPGSLTTSGYPRIVKLWKRGTPIANAKTVYEGQSSDVGINPLVFRGPYGVAALVARGITFYETEYYYVNADGSIRKLPLPLGADVKGVTEGNLILTLREDWSLGNKHFAKGSLLAVPLGPWVAGAALPAVVTLYTPGPRSSIEEVSAGRDAVYAAIYDNVIGSVRAFRQDEAGAWSSTKLDLPPGGSVHVMSTNDWGPEAQFSFESYLVPPTLYHDTGDNHPIALKSLPARFDASGLVMAQFEATSKDGTKIPYFVVQPKDRAKPAPTVLYGYGGFEISLTPSYSANFGRLWLTKGGVYVVANIRGGGEFGPAWHDAALLTNRQKAYDDFQAVAQDLVTRGITTPKQLGIMGGSNGGLLVSANMVERPDLFGAVVCQVPLIDMIRYTQIGAGASWEAEYGDPAKPELREAILKYSPYQNVKKDVTYPPVLFVTATSDDRVTPVHARKMAARMEAQGHDVLFYENTDGGHAAAANHKQAAEMWALSFVYLKQKLQK